MSESGPILTHRRMTRVIIQWSRSTGGLLPQLPVLNPHCSEPRRQFTAACVSFYHKVQRKGGDGGPRVAFVARLQTVFLSNTWACVFVCEVDMWATLELFFPLTALQPCDQPFREEVLGFFYIRTMAQAKGKISGASAPLLSLITENALFGVWGHLYDT